MSEQDKPEVPDKTECDRCDKCCVTVGSPPVMDDEVAEWPEPLQFIYNCYIHGDGAKDRYDRELPCFFYGGQGVGCRIQDVKPQICRDHFCWESDDD